MNWNRYFIWSCWPSPIWYASLTVLERNRWHLGEISRTTEYLLVGPHASSQGWHRFPQYCDASKKLTQRTCNHAIRLLLLFLDVCSSPDPSSVLMVSRFSKEFSLVICSSNEGNAAEKFQWICDVVCDMYFFQFNKLDTENFIFQMV